MGRVFSRESTITPKTVVLRVRKSQISCAYWGFTLEIASDTRPFSLGCHRRGGAMLCVIAASVRHTRVDSCSSQGLANFMECSRMGHAVVAQVLLNVELPD